MAFENLEGAVSLTEAMQPVLPEETEFQDPWSDEVALGIVLADVDNGIRIRSI